MTRLEQLRMIWGVSRYTMGAEVKAFDLPQPEALPIYIGDVHITDDRPMKANILTFRRMFWHVGAENRSYRWVECDGIVIEGTKPEGYPYDRS